MRQRGLQVGGALAGNILMKHSQYLLKGTDYTAVNVISDLDITGDVQLAVGANTITATVVGNVFVWKYTNRSAVGGLNAARLTESSGF